MNEDKANPTKASDSQSTLGALFGLYQLKSSISLPKRKNII
jgi:hypothetical protein